MEITKNTKIGELLENAPVVFPKFIISEKSLGSISFFLPDRYIFLAFFGRKAYSKHNRKRDVLIVFTQIYHDSYMFDVFSRVCIFIAFILWQQKTGNGKGDGCLCLNVHSVLVCSVWKAVSFRWRQMWVMVCPAFIWWDFSPLRWGRQNSGSGQRFAIPVLHFLRRRWRSICHLQMWEKRERDMISRSLSLCLRQMEL